jgi:hypothetical protein
VTHPIWSVFPAAAAGVVVVLAVVSYGSPVGASSASSSAANSYPCSHAGGGLWEVTWNNSSGSGPTHVFVPMPGYWWAEYNNSTGASAYLGWGTVGTGILGSSPGWTTVNMTNDPTVAAAMATFACANANSALPWHYDFATQTFVRNP